MRPCQSQHAAAHGTPLPTDYSDDTIAVRFWCGWIGKGWMACRFMRMSNPLIDVRLSDVSFQTNNLLRISNKKLLSTAAASQAVAHQNKVAFAGKTPHIYDESTSVQIQRTTLLSSQLPQQLGEVAIHSSFALTQTCPDSEFTGVISLEWQVYDHGETLGHESERCEFLSAAASDRVAAWWCGRSFADLS